MKNLIEKAEQLLAEIRGTASTVVSYNLTAGEKARVECGRPGTFVSMESQKLTLGSDHFVQMAAGFKAEDEHLVKVGHKKIETDTPHYGDVVGLEYDAEKSRLFAEIVPTPALVRKNREEGFRRCSMEIIDHGEKGWEFAHLAMLAARRPAISGLAPIALAAEAGEGTFVYLEEGEEPEERPEVHVDQPQSEEGLDKPPNTQSGKSEESQESGGQSEMDEKEAAEKRAKELEEREKAFAARARKSAEADATRFLASPEIVKRVGLKSKAAAEKLLIELAAMEADGQGTVKLAEGEKSLYALAREVIEGMPVQLSESETREVVRDGQDGTVEALFDINEDAGFRAEPESARLYALAIGEIQKEKALGNTIDFKEASRRAFARR